MLPDINKKINKKINDFVDDLFYGKKEDIFVRNARRMQINETFKNENLAAFIPGYYAYNAIKSYKNDPELSKKEKLVMYSIAIGGEIMLDILRVGAAATIYYLAKENLI